MVNTSPDKQLKTSLQAFEKHLKSFIKDRDFNKRDYKTSEMTDPVRKGKQMVADISNRLYVDH
jgi:hypothetical protein